MYPNSIYSGLKIILFGYFGAKVYTIWVHGPLGFVGCFCFRREFEARPSLDTVQGKERTDEAAMQDQHWVK